MCAVYGNRKSTRLSEYDYSSPGFYFVTLCTYKIEDKYPGVKIDSSCVMPDHVHAIIALTGGHMGPPLQEVVQWFKTQTTNEYIRQVRRGIVPPFEKHVWQRSYYDHITRNDFDLDETRKYIVSARER